MANSTQRKKAPPLPTMSELLDQTLKGPPPADPPQMPPAEPYQPPPLLDPDGNPPDNSAAPENIDRPPAEPGPSNDLTIGEVLGQIQADPEAPTLQGFEMSDEPLPVPSTASPPPAGVSAANAGGAIPDQAITPPSDDILSPSARRIHDYNSGSTIRYEGRIRVLEAFQYMGKLVGAPDWIDRNWLGFADYDELRKINAGPCLRVPLASGTIAIARIGDFVVQQEVILAVGMPGDVRVEVWPQAEFVKNFMPVVADLTEVG